MPDGITVTPIAEPTATDQSYSFDEVRPIAGLLGLDTHNIADTDNQALKTIYDFVRGDSKEMTELEMLSKLRTLENRLGLTTLGERRIDKVYRYVKIQSQIDQLEKNRDRELR